MKTPMAVRRRAERDARGRHPTARRQPDGRGPRARHRRVSPLFGLLVVLGFGLSLYGLVMVLSASSGDALGGGDPWTSFRRQALWLLAGLIAALFTSRLDYRLWRERLAVPLLVVTAALLVLVLVPSIGLEVNGARRWIGVGGFTFQPSELAKLALIIWIADMVTRRNRDVGDLSSTLLPVLLWTGGFAVLLVAEPDLGTAIVVCTVVFVVLFMAGASLQHLWLLGGATACMALTLAWLAPYRRERLLAFTDPWADPLESGYQTVQAGVALANGGVSGVGLGASRGKWGFLPEAQTDFIYAIVAEEFGLIGGLSVLLAFVLIGGAGYLVANRMRQRDPFASLVAVGITTWIVLQAFVNIGAVVGALPITGVTLPFLSAGGSSLVVTMAGFGVLLNIASHVE
ncbi:MAG: putative lipid II flippase FtsW [Acidimicrobiia bacterium]|nr:putative lipid II flippase FtsW [Acidimicrobiia bacterium]